MKEYACYSELGLSAVVEDLTQKGPVSVDGWGEFFERPSTSSLKAL